jgi:Predicted transcriptional regulators
MDMRKKIELACTYSAKSQATLARALGVTPQTFNKRLRTCKFSVEELQKIAETLGATYNYSFDFDDGTTF